MLAAIIALFDSPTVFKSPAAGATASRETQNIPKKPLLISLLRPCIDRRTHLHLNVPCHRLDPNIFQPKPQFLCNVALQRLLVALDLLDYRELIVATALS